MVVCEYTCPEKSTMKWNALALCLACSVGSAHASLVTFDDVSTAVAARVPDGYQGLNWFNFAVQNTATAGSAGFANAAVSPSYVAFNNNGTTAMLFGPTLPLGSPPNPAANDFVFNSAYFTAVYLHGLNIHLTGYLDGAQVYVQTIIADIDAARLSDFNWKVDALYFTADGGTSAGFAVDAPYFAMDNLRINETPEPGTWALLGLGLGGLVWSRRNAR